MKREAVSGIMIILMLTSMLTLTLNIQSVKASGTIYIRANGSIDPPTANITSADNVTYTFTDNNYDEIVVERNNIVVDGAGYSIFGAENAIGIDLSYRTNVTIVCMVIMAGTGVMLQNSSRNVISRNNITNSIYGIWLWVSFNNTIQRNALTDNERGIYFYGSRDNTVFENNVAFNEYGFYLRRHAVHPTLKSRDNKIFHNNLFDNAVQVRIENSLMPNFWDDGYPSGGNYWSDYVGNDTLSGPYQNETGSDGIGDTSYPIDTWNIDYYPLINANLTLPWADDDGDGVLNYLDVPNYNVSTSNAIEKLLFAFDWSAEISVLYPKVSYSYMMKGLYKWGVKKTLLQNYMRAVIIDLGNVMDTMEWLRDKVPGVVTEQIVNKIRSWACSDGHVRYLFFVHSDLTVLDILGVLGEWGKSLLSGDIVEGWFDLFADMLNRVGFEIYQLKGAYSVSANLVFDLSDFIQNLEVFVESLKVFKDILIIALNLVREVIKAEMTGGLSLVNLAKNVLVKTFKFLLDHVAYDWTKIGWILDWIKIILIEKDPPGERVVLQLYNGTTQELLLGYNATSFEDIPVFPYGIYISENDSAIMILSRSTVNYNLTANRNFSNSSTIPYTLVTWDCVGNYTITNGGFLEPNQTSSSTMKVENDTLKMSYLVVEAAFSDYNPRVGDDVLININVTDNLRHDIENVSVAMVVADQHILAQDLGNGKYQVTLNTSAMLGFYNVTIFTAQTPLGYLQGISTYPLMVGVADIAITNVNSSKTVVGKGYLTSITVTVENQGNSTETYLAIYANTTAIQEQTVLTLSGGNSTTITLAWNTTNFRKGNYTMKAYVSPVLGETDLSDNNFTNGEVLITIPGDANGDRIVDIFDIGTISSHWYPGPPTGPLDYHPNADINDDGAVGIFEIGIVSSKWGQTW